MLGNAGCSKKEAKVGPREMAGGAASSAGFQLEAATGKYPHKAAGTAVGMGTAVAVRGHSGAGCSGHKLPCSATRLTAGRASGRKTLPREFGRRASASSQGRVDPSLQENQDRRRPQGKKDRGQNSCIPCELGH